MPKSRFSYNSTIIGAAFLMATSAIGPGFLTQTTVFTEKMQANFGFIILLSILLDLGVQLNVWPIITVTGRRAQDLSNDLLKGLGYVVSALIVIGGLAFNIGNIAGAGLGIEILTGISVETGAILSGIFAILLFMSKEAGHMIDKMSQILGVLMLLLIVYVVFTANPPVAAALQHSILPTEFDALATITLVGGTVGGYITFAGAHRLVDANITGVENLQEVKKSATMGILVTSIVRYGLFLAALGVVASGAMLDEDNPPASVFKIAAGNLGFKFFGIVMWSAAITSVVGSAYTSVSFLRTFHPWLERNHKSLITNFITFSTIVFVFFGKPIQVLVWVGTLNGFILPITLSVILIVARKSKLLGTYKHPLGLQLVGWLVVAMMLSMSIYSLL